MSKRNKRLLVLVLAGLQIALVGTVAFFASGKGAGVAHAQGNAFALLKLNSTTCFISTTTPTHLTGGRGGLQYRTITGVDTYGEKANIVYWMTTRSDFNCGLALKPEDLRNSWIEVGYFAECGDHNGCDSPERKLYIGEKRKDKSYHRAFKTLPTGIAEYNFLEVALVPADATGSRWRALIGKNGQSTWALDALIPDPKRWPGDSYSQQQLHDLGHRADSGLEMDKGTEVVPPTWVFPQYRAAGSSSWYSFPSMNLQFEAPPPPCAIERHPWLLAHANSGLNCNQ